MYNPWQSFTASSGHHMTGVDIGECGESWPLTEGGSSAEVFENQSEESQRHRVRPRAARFLTVNPFYFSWNKLHTIRNYRGLLSLVRAVAMATQIHRWSQVSFFTVFCCQKGWQIFGGLRRIKYLGRKIIIMGFLFIVSFYVTEAAAFTNISWITKIDMVTVNDSEPQIEIAGQIWSPE